MRAWRSVGSWLLLLALLALAPLLARSAPATTTMAPTGAASMLGAWDEGFSLPGLGRSSYLLTSVADNQGNVYIGGYFSSVFGVPAANIARWDGEQWSALGTGVTGPYAGVGALVVDASGNLFVGGSFTSAGGVPNTTGLARWDGTTWHPVGWGLLGIQHGEAPFVTSLALAPNNQGIYVGGKFKVASNQTITHLSRWDGLTWQPLRYGVTNTVRDLATHTDGSLYVTGDFTSVDRLAVPYIARWDGNAWHPLGAGLASPGSALTVDGQGGVYVDGGPPGSGAGVGRWDGQSWSTLSTTRPADLSWGADGRLYAGGGFTAFNGNEEIEFLAQWDGTTWSSVGGESMRSGASRRSTPFSGAVIGSG